jgi:hypothetical protein
MVLLPRVGTPAREQMALYTPDGPVGLSDCVLAIPCGTEEEAERLYLTLFSRWPDLAKLYGGSCARYLRVDRLVHFLTQLEQDEHGAGAATEEPARPLTLA